MTENLVLIESANDIDAGLKLGAVNVFASFNERIVEKLRARGLKTFWLGAYIQDNERIPIEKEGWDLAKAWAERPEVQSAYRHRGIDLAASAIFELSLHMTWLTKLRIGLTKLLAERKFEKIYAVKIRAALISLNPCADTYYCALMVQCLGYAVQPIEVKAERKKSTLALKDAVRPLAQKIYSIVRPILTENSSRKTVLVTGAFQQMQELMPELQKDFRVLHMDYDFRLQKMPSLIKYRIPNYSFKEEAPKNNMQATPVVLPGPMGDTWQRATHPLLDFLWNEWRPKQIRAVDYFLDFFSTNKVGFVILDEDVTSFYCALSLCARLVGAKTMVIAHYSAPSPAGYELQPVSDYLAVGSEFIKKCLTNVGLPEDKLVVTGIPRYTQLIQGQTKLTPLQVRHRLKISDSQQIVLFAFSLDFFQWYTRREWSGIKRALVDVLDTMNKTREMFLVIKFHPLSDASFLEACYQIIQNHSFKNICAVVYADTPSLIRAAHTMITFHSSVALEGALLKKPTVVLDYFPFEPIATWFFNEDRLLVRDKKSLSEALNGIWNNESEWMLRTHEFNRKLVGAWLDPQSVNACARIRTIVKEALEKKNERLAVV